MAHVFISYSRRDQAFVRRLNDALRARGKETWVDWEGILPSAEWLKEIYTAIESADAFLFILSPDSVSSEVCAQELAHATINHKRLVPVLHRDIPSDQVPSNLAAHNWVFLRDGDDFERALDQIILALEVDLHWVHRHTRLLTRAREWEAAGREGSFTLRGRDLKSAQAMMERAASTPKDADSAANRRRQPSLTPLQTEYILASQRAAAKRQMMTGGVVAAGLLILAVLGMTAHERQRAATLEASRNLEMRALAEMNESDFPTAQSLLARSLSLEDREETRLLLLEARTRGAGLLGSLPPSEPGEAALAIRPDARQAVLTEDGGTTVHFVDMAPADGGAPRPVRVAPPCTSPILRGDYSGDGHRLLTAHADGTITVWDTAACRPLHTVRLSGIASNIHRASGSALGVDTTGARIATCDESRTVRIWDISTGHLLVTLQEAEEMVRCTAFSPDGRHIAGGSIDNNVYLWDAATGKQERVLHGHEDEITSVRFTPDGRQLLTGSWDTNVGLWDIAREERIHTFSGLHSGALRTCLTRDGTRLYAGDEHGSVRVWEVETGRCLLTLPCGHEVPITGLALSTDERRLSTSTGDGGVKVWDVGRRPDVATLRGHEQVVAAVSYPRNGDGRLLGSGSADGTARLWDGLTGTPQRVLHGAPQGIWTLDFSPDGRLLATGGRDTTVRIWNPITGQLLRKWRVPPLRGPIRRVAFFPDSTRIAAAADDDGIRIWDARTGKLLNTLTHDTVLMNFAISRDGRLLATAGRDGIIRVHDTGTGAIVRRLRGHIGSTWGVQFSSDGRRLVTSGEDGTVRIWDTGRGNLLQLLRGVHDGAVWDCCFSPDGQRVASAGQDGTICLWDLATGKALPLRGHSGAVWALAFSPDGRRLASGSQDHTVRIWRIDRLLTELSEPAADLIRQAEEASGTSASDAEPLR